MGGGLPEAEGTEVRPRSRRGDSALVFLVTALVFLPGVFGEFVNWDDDRNFLQNLDYRGLDWPNVRWMLTTSHMGPWAPLSWVTLAADYLLWGMSPRGYHLTSLFFHSASATLFLLIARRLLRAAQPGAPEGALRIGAVGAALLFAVHPLRVESVVWITERRDVVSGFFYMLTVLAYLRAVEGRLAGMRLEGKYWLSLGCFAAAVLSKSMVVSLPAVLLILDVYPLRRLPGEGGWTGAAARRVMVEKIPFLLLSAVGGSAAFAALRPWGNMLSLDDFGVAERIAVSAYGLAFYLWKTLVPLGLSPLYGLSHPLNPLALPFVTAGAAVLGLSAAAVIARRRCPWLAAAWCAYVVTVLPVAGVFQNGPQIAADRYTYLPMLGWALLGGAGLAWCASRWIAGAAGKRPAGAVLATALGLVIALAALASRQSLVWQDSITLWRHAVALDPGSMRPRVYLGGALLGAGWLEPAEREFETAVRLDPRDPEALIGLAATLALSGRAQEAMAPAREAARRRPRDAEIQYHLGEVLRAAGHREEALAAYGESSRVRPRSPAGGYRAATMLAEMGRTEDALAALAEAQRVGRAADPADPEAERVAALVHAHVDPVRAIEAWERYLALMRRLRDPSLSEMGKMVEAMASFEALRERRDARASSVR
ncbi:MAG: hypothetical protein HYV93_07985 [Candidatus Rokubacteria bacterium]|nr:hypothetical protein [Candidatus Rokubacteria bacterium]